MLTRVSKRSESRAARSSSWGCRLPARGRRGLATSSGPPTATISSTLRTLSPSATIRWATPLHRGTVGERQQGPRVPGRQHPGSDPAGDQRRQLEQPQGVGDLRPRAADPGGELVVGAAEVLEQLLVCRGLLERVQLAAVQVLQEGVAQQVVVVGLLDDGRDGGLAGLLGGPPATLTHDELVEHALGGVVELVRPLTCGNGPDDDGLEHPDLADRVHQLGHVVLVEDRPGLARVGPDLLDRDLAVGHPGHRRQAVRAVRRRGLACAVGTVGSPVAARPAAGSRRPSVRSIVRAWPSGSGRRRRAAPSRSAG